MATRNTARHDAASAYVLVSTGPALRSEDVETVAGSHSVEAQHVLIQLGERAPDIGIGPDRTVELSAPLAEVVGSALRRLADALTGIELHPEGAEQQDSWGPVIDAQDAHELERENLHLQARQRREQLTASFSRSEVAEMLDVSTQTVSDMRVQNRLIGLRDGREWRFPAWQFTPDDAEPVLPDLARLVREFPGGVVSLSRWMTRPNADFDGRTPQQEMLRDREHVFAVLHALTAA